MVRLENKKQEADAAVRQLFVLNELKKEQMAKERGGGPSGVHLKTRCFVSLDVCVPA